MGGGDQGGMAVPVGEGTAFEVGQAEPGLQFAVVVLDPPADLRQADQVPQPCVSGQGRQPVIGGLTLTGRPFGQQPALGQVTLLLAGNAALAGRTRSARKREVMIASGLPGVCLLPRRHRTRRNARRPAARASSRTVERGVRYVATGRRPVPAYGVISGSASDG